MALAITKVKKDIEFNKRFNSIIEVLKAIAVSQFHILEKKIKVFERFDPILQEFFDSVDTENLQHPFLGSGEVQGPRIVVGVTSDQGLLGGGNMRIVKTAIGLMDSERDLLVVIGEQGKKFARDSHVSFEAFPGIQDDQRYAQARALRTYLFKQVATGMFRSIQIIYNRAFSLVNQRMEINTLLPVSRTEGKSSAPRVSLSQMILETSFGSILEYLIYLSMGRKLNDIFGMSRLAELAARFVHLEESTQRIQELNRKLTLKYFRLRHELIDQSMRELFAARSLYAQ